MSRTLTLLAFAVMCALNPAQAQQSPQFGLYVDSTHTEHCTYGTADYYPIDVYLWARPGENGMTLMTFQILYPDIVIPAYLVYNEAIVMGINGTPQNGMDVYFEECQTDWVWALRHTVLLTSEEPGMVQLYPDESTVVHWDRLSFNIYNCLGYGESRFEVAEPVSNVCINFCTDDVTPPGVEELLVIDPMTLEVTFTEEVTAESAEDIGNYLVYSRYVEADSIYPVSADLLPGDTTVVLVFAEPFGCYPDKIFRGFRISDMAGNMWSFLETFAITSSFADLMVLESAHIDTIAGCVDSIIVSCTIRNAGVCPAAPSRVQLYYDELTEHGAFLGRTDLGYQVFAGLVSGGTAVVQFDLAIGSLLNHTFGSYGRFRLHVDPYDDVDESNETNNTHDSRLVVLPPRDIAFELIGNTVRAEFTRSLLDRLDIPEPVTSYEILWSAGWTGGFEVAAVVIADGSLEYVCEFPMTSDRDFSVFYIQAVRTAGGTTYNYDTCPEWHKSGMDLPPAAPVGFTGYPVDLAMYLEWDQHPEEDIYFYVLEWSETIDFPPVSDPPGYPFGELVLENHFTHYAWNPGDEFFYRLCAVDSSLNCSDFVIIAPWHEIGTELQSFSSSVREGKVTLTWSVATSQEEDDPRFSVFRSLAGGGTFVQLSSTTEQKSEGTYQHIDTDARPGEEYIYRVEVIDEDGSRVLFETDPISMPALALTLYQNHPNPLNPSTTISFYLPERCAVRLEVFDVAGRCIASLIDESIDKGSHTAEWKGTDLNGSVAASGVYFYRLTAGKKTISKKMILLR